MPTLNTICHKNRQAPKIFLLKACEHFPSVLLMMNETYYAVELGILTAAHVVRLVSFRGLVTRYGEGDGYAFCTQSKASQSGSVHFGFYVGRVFQ
jgi:hypothetical protein